MKQTPFLALPRGEQLALMGALRQAGLALPGLCVSLQEVPDDPEAGWITVSGAGWCRRYPLRPGWERELLEELQVSAQPAVRGGGA
jgi:hypothetical protein